MDLARIDRVYGFQRHVVIKRPLEHLREDPAAVLGLVVLATTASARPAMYAIGRVVMTRSGHDAAAWDGRWSSCARFRRIWRTVTVFWGAGLLVDAVVRVVLAYTVPVDVVPALHAVQWFPLLIVLQILSRLYLRRPGNRELVFS